MEKLRWELSQSLNLIKKNPPIVMMIPLIGLIFAFARKAGYIYLDMLIPLLLITFLTYFLTGMVNGNYKIVNYVMILLTVGTLLQCVFLEENMVASQNNTWAQPIRALQIQYLVAFGVACAGGFFYRYYEKISSLKWCKFYIILSILLPIVTLVLAKAVGGVKNWIRIGGFSIQTTEIVKFLYVLIAAALLGTNGELSKRRIYLFYAITGIDILFLGIQSEFGTMLLILLIFLVYVFLFIPDIRVFIKTVIVLAVIIGTVALLGIFLSGCNARGNFLGTNPLAEAFLRNYNKIANRFIFWINPGKDPDGWGYQLIQARNSIVYGGLFGTTLYVELPVRMSDMVYPALIQRCGMILGLVVFLVFILLWLEGIFISVRKKERYHSAVVTGYTFMLFFQTLIIIGGSTGLCPLTGITLPFIASGGTSLMICALSVGLLLAISGNVSWKGNNTDEEAFSKEIKVAAKCYACLRHLYARCTRAIISYYTRARSKSRSDKGSNER